MTPPHDLTEREIRTLRLIALGYGAKAIARRDGVSVAAVTRRVWRASLKLGTVTTVSTVLMAYQLGCFTLPRIGTAGWVTR